MAQPYSEIAVELYDRGVVVMVRRLHDLADEVERQAEASPSPARRDGDERPDYLLAAQRVVHAVTWGMASLDLDGIVAGASDVHHARDLERARSAGVRWTDDR